MLTERAAERTTGTVLRGFEDGLGRRYRPAPRSENEAPLEILCFRHEITDVPSFEFALRERVARISEFHHPYYARIRKVDRLSDERGTVALMSDGAPGDRLVEILAAAERGGPVLDINAALYLIRQLVPAIAALHEKTRVAHGAIAPERLFVTPLARLFVVEHALGAALEQLKYTRERYWKELRVALPAFTTAAAFDERADLTQVGMVGLSLILGRPLRDDEYPGKIEELVASASARTADGARQPLPSELREWLSRALQLEARSSFRSLFEAQNALDQLMSRSKYSADLLSLEAFLERFHTSAKPAPSPAKSSPVPDTSVRRIEPQTQPLETPPATLTHVEPMPASTLSGGAEEEIEDEEWDPMIPKRSSGRGKWISVGLVLMMATTGGLYAARRHFSSAALPVTSGTMTVNSNPPGAQVDVDGATRGQTPISLSLPAGPHTLVVRGNGEPRTIPITIEAGAQLSQYLDLPKAMAAVGQLQVRSEPSGARISVDGVARGTTPLTMVDLTPGEHAVRLESDLGAVTQTVTIEAGNTAALVVPLAAATQGASVSGFVSVTAPVVMDLFEQGRLLGTTAIDRIMLPTGRHDIEIVSEPLAYRETRTVQVGAGRVASIAVTLPKGTLSINAVPWASVSIDGESVGDTPIGNLPITIGPHEVVFRNAELGEQRRVVTVTLRSPVRLSVEMKK